MGILEQEMKRFAQQAGGSHKTVHDRIKLAQRFCERLVLAQSERLNNRSLGLSGASRNGTKQAITPEHYRDVLETARVKDPGMAAALELSRLMGLRSQEAVQSVQSLKTW
ncbi:putative DNA binding protein [Salmonella enterica subsp. enterica serovar Virchow str. SVQ1]|nr:hypothetical protein FORC38_0720 [Salmonella enterica]ETO88594.1 putative DNA binding protein [Salmonella enterica subsp. enterica serovar Virchow str. SVQ1]CAH2820537.1 hypothetical protein SENB94_16340 [Salmonella enterica subsp. enterica serovar Virchow]CAH2860249.1 hypothetical protein SEN2437_21120 [Salmonella enterica subsp. enterica serovar Virchow]